MTAVAVAQGRRSAQWSQASCFRHPASEFGVGPLAVTAWHPRLLVLAGACENVSLGASVCVCMAQPSGSIWSGSMIASAASTSRCRAARLSVTAMPSCGTVAATAETC